MKRFPMAVLISLSREGLICSVTRALKRDKMYLAQKAYQKDEGGSGWAEKREIRLLSSYCLPTVLLFKFSCEKKDFPENFDFSLVGST